ncbi:MAG: zinc-binding dehydrogenase [Gemmataceae bacterium]
MKAVLFDRFGPAEEVLQVREVPAPRPSRGQVLVRMIASPINPSDLLFVEGVYGRRPTLPATPGFEGVGRVIESGGGLLGWRVLGRRVAVLNAQGGNWQELVVIPARQAVPLPEDLSDEQAATFFVNPATVLAMLEHVLRVRRGDWLAQTAAGSALGRMIIRYAARYGLHTINIVRRRDIVSDLKNLGADEVLVQGQDDILARIMACTANRGVSYVLDAVGGEIGSLLVESLAPGGRMLVYGTLSQQPLTLAPRHLMTGMRRVEGFWLSEWARRQRALTMLRLFRKIARCLRMGILSTAIEETYPMAAIAEAVRAAKKPGRQGKILVQF